MTPEEVLAQAADLIESGRWCQGTRVDDDLNFCLEGAIMRVARQKWLSEATPARIAFDAVGQEVWPIYPWRWNDTPGRTKEEVAAVLRNAKRWLKPIE